jgi:hypothetical protein
VDLVVANATAGGGGAGGFRQFIQVPIAGLPVTVQGYPITVGAGGAVGPATSHI